MSKSSHLRPYESPNIVIVPTVSFLKKNDPLKLHKDQLIKQNVAEGNPEIAQNVQNNEKDTQITNIGASDAEQPDSVSKETPCDEDVNKNLEKTKDLNKTKKAPNSWASNYLQSIGHNNIKPIKINLSCKPKVHKIEIVSSNNRTVASSGYLQNLPLKDPTPSLNVVPNISAGNAVAYFKYNDEVARTHANTGNSNTLKNENLYVPYLHNTPQALEMPLSLPWRENTSANENVYMPHTYEKPQGLEMPFLLPQSYQSTPVNPNFVLDTIYSTQVPTYTNNHTEASYGYHEGVSIYDAIRNEINNSMNFPSKTHDNGKDLIQERHENSASSSKTKSDFGKSPSPRKTQDSNRHSKKYASETSDKKHSIIKISEESRTIKKRTSEKDSARKSSKLSLKKQKSPKILGKVSKKECSLRKEKKPKIKSNTERSAKKEHVSKSTKVKDDEKRRNAKQQYDKESASQSTINHSLEVRKLKRVRYDSDDLSYIRPFTNSDFSSPIRSTSQKPEKRVTNQLNKKNCDESFDLRSKLNERINKRRLNMDQDSQPLSKKPRDNLKITVENNITPTTPKKACGPQYKSKAKKCRKLKLIINVVCQDESSNDSSDSNCSDNNPANKDTDLSFLDDFNIDEIVDSLKNSPAKHKINCPIDNRRKPNTKIEATLSKPTLLVENSENIAERSSKNESLEDFVKMNRSTSLSKSCRYPRVETLISKEAAIKKPIVDCAEKRLESLVDLLLAQTRYKMAQNELQNKSPSLHVSDGNNIMNNHKSCIVDMSENIINAPVTTTPYHTILNEIQCSKTDQLDKKAIEQNTVDKYAYKDYTTNKLTQQEINIDTATVIQSVPPTLTAVTQKRNESARGDYFIDLTIVDENDNSDSNDLLTNKAIESISVRNKDNSEKPTEFNGETVKKNILDAKNAVIRDEVMQDYISKIINNARAIRPKHFETDNGISNTSENCIIDLTIVDKVEPDNLVTNEVNESVRKSMKISFQKSMEQNGELFKEISADAINQTIRDATKQINANNQENTSDKTKVTQVSQESTLPLMSSNKIDTSKIGNKRIEKEFDKDQNKTEELTKINAELENETPDNSLSAVSYCIDKSKIDNEHIKTIEEPMVLPSVTTTPYHSILNEIQCDQSGQLDEKAIEQDTVDRYANKDYTANKLTEEEIILENATVIQSVQPTPTAVTQKHSVGAREDSLIDFTIVDEDGKSGSNGLLTNKAIQSLSVKNKDTSENLTEFIGETLKLIIVDAIDVVIRHEADKIDADCHDDISHKIMKNREIQPKDAETDNGILNTSEDYLLDLTFDYDDGNADFNNLVTNEAVEFLGDKSMNTFNKTIDLNVKSLKEKGTNSDNQTIRDASKQINADCQENTLNKATGTQRPQESILPSMSVNKIDMSEIDKEQIEIAEEPMEINTEPVQEKADSKIDTSVIDQKHNKTTEEPIGINAKPVKEKIDNKNDTSKVENEHIKSAIGPTDTNAKPVLTGNKKKEKADNKKDMYDIKEEHKTAEEPMEINAEPVKENYAHCKNNIINESIIKNESPSTIDKSLNTTEGGTQIANLKTEIDSKEPLVGQKNILKESEVICKNEPLCSKIHSGIDTKDSIRKENIKQDSYQLPVLEITLDSKNVKIHNVDNIQDESIREIGNNVSVMNKVVGNTKGQISTENKTIQTTKDDKKTMDLLAARLKNIKDISDNKNITICEQKNTSRTKNASHKNGSNVTGPYKALADKLEKRILEYMHKPFNITSIIRSGQFSNIFKCNDSNGQKYAAKVIKGKVNRLKMGLEKEQMIREIQMYIPRDNLYTVYLFDGFGVERSWCHLMEYYPRNLAQDLGQREKPFHIDHVQLLARQLLSAVMVLRNNDIIHSDIKPSHLLINDTSDKIKLCGFDRAYRVNAVEVHHWISSPPYRAPELILGVSAGYSVDVWCSALVIQEMTTKRKLFNGVYNNDILYQQMCFFGGLPRDMIVKSPYSQQHFAGPTFLRRMGFQGQTIIKYHKFYKTKRLHKYLQDAYNQHWSQLSGQQRYADLHKIFNMALLLEKMLIMDPRRRLAIEFVCANPFIYEMFTKE